MQQLKYFCDVCEKECVPADGMSTLTGIIAKMNKELKKEAYKFGGDYCAEDSEIILGFIATFKEEKKNESARPVKQTEHGGKSEPSSK